MKKSDVKRALSDVMKSRDFVKQNPVLEARARFEYQAFFINNNNKEKRPEAIWVDNLILN